MLHSNIKVRNSTIEGGVFGGNINSINIHAIEEIQKEIEPCDMISLVFLLYDSPDTALQRLLVYERVYRDIGKNSDLLRDWALYAKNKNNWKHEFLEALVTCQLFSIIRKLGFNVFDVKKRYDQVGDTAYQYINPMKKLLYRLCEHMESNNVAKLKRSLQTYGINTSDYESCELIFLDLMCKKFISIHPIIYGNTVTASEYKMTEFADIIQGFEGLEQFAYEMRLLENKTPREENETPTTSKAFVPLSQTKIKDDNVKEKYRQEDFKDTFQEMHRMLEEMTIENLKSDKRSLDMYEIKNPSKVGVCYIINQEDFQSMKNNSQRKPLQNRVGSTYDKKALENTMSYLNFEVITSDNLDHRKMMQSIKDVIACRVRHHHSIFMLCILSHGTKGYIYAADSVKVQIEDIENLLECDDAKHLQNMPKVIILQACQVDDDEHHVFDLVADGPHHHIKKSDILLYLATAPGFEAFRLETYGSLFIQALCLAIKEFADRKHLTDLFTIVTNCVHRICQKLRRDQLPKIYTTLLKPLYLKKPRQ